MHKFVGVNQLSERPRTTSSQTAVWLAAGLGLITVLFVVRIFSPSELSQSLPDAARDFFTLSISVFIESLPFIFLGVLLSIVVQIWLPASVFDRVLPKTPILRRAVMSLFGILLPVCECGNVPLSRGLMMRGFTVAESLTFLLAAPILNPVTIITTYQAFGFDNGILLGRIVGGFVIANFIGYLFSKHPDQGSLLTSKFQYACEHPHSAESGTKIQRSVQAFATETSAMLPALVIGCAIAGAIQVGVPRELMLALGSNPLWSVLALIALAFVISICSNVDAFFILAFAGTFMPGAIVAFLIFGAMIDIKMLALLRTTYSTSTLARVTAVVALCTLAIGFGVNLIV